MANTELKLEFPELTNSINELYDTNDFAEVPQENCPF